MITIALVVSALLHAPTSLPRTCASCGIYVGPNTSLVLDPYLRRVDIWPEFEASTCQFEVARGAFVTLSRTACASEATYRNGRS